MWRGKLQDQAGCPTLLSSVVEGVVCDAWELVGEQFRWDLMSIYSVTRGVFVLLAICEVQLALLTPAILADNKANCSKKQADLESVLGDPWWGLDMPPRSLQG